jgi:hypothetical protein
LFKEPIFMSVKKRSWFRISSILLIVFVAALWGYWQIERQSLSDSAFRDGGARISIEESTSSLLNLAEWKDRGIWGVPHRVNAARFQDSGSRVRTVVCLGVDTRNANQIFINTHFSAGGIEYFEGSLRRKALADYENCREMSIDAGGNKVMALVGEDFREARDPSSLNAIGCIARYGRTLIHMYIDKVDHGGDVTSTTFLDCFASIL